MKIASHIFFVLVGCLSVAGSACAQQSAIDASYTKHMKQAAKEASVEVNRCKNRHMHSEFKNHVQFAACVNQAISVAYQRAGYRYPDLTEAMNAKRLDIAQRIDKKEIAESQGNKEFFDFSAQMAKEEISRDRARNVPPVTIMPSNSDNQ
jgi:hypothetical protein